MSIAAALPASPATAPPRVATATVTTLVLAGLLTAAYYALFWHEWRDNPDLSHAIFTPVLFAVLLHESRAHGPWRWLPATPWVTAATLLALGVGLALLVAGGLYAVALDWSSALVGFVLAAALAGLLLAALLWLAGTGVRAIPLNWPALCAVALWPLSAPIPPGTYTRLTLSLQLMVTKVVLNALHLLGIPALQSGNIITLAVGNVGVEEACSGVRSLVACIVAGIFFSATLVRRPAARALLVALAAPLAIVMNIVRSLTLTLLANAGINISGTWHDATGFAVLGLTAALLGGLALLLESRTPAATPSATVVARDQQSWRTWLLPTGLGVALALVVSFALNTHTAPAQATGAPDLAALLPARSADWELVTTDDLGRYTSTLQTDHLVQRTFLRHTLEGELQITIYVAWWSPGAVPVSLVASHTPDACWPTGGTWTQQPTPTLATALPLVHRTLPAPVYLFFKSSVGFPQHTWYWHLHAGQPIAHTNPRSPVELLRLGLRYGFQTAGAQLFVRVSSNQPWEKIAAEPLLVDFFAKLQPLGL
jgi:exosortase